MENKVTKFMFYDLYWSLIKGGNNKAAGRFAKRICTVMFTDDEPASIEDKEEAFVWSNIEDILRRSKEVELNGKTAKSLNRQMAHFAFLESYYRAIDLMNEEQSGAYLKALCMYMFENAEPPKLPPPADKYFALAKLKLSLSKMRSIAARSDGKKSREAAEERAQKTVEAADEELVKEEANGSAEEAVPMTFEEFKKLHPNIDDDIFQSGKKTLDRMDWDKVNDLIKQDKTLSEVHSLYRLLQNERVKTAIKNG